MSETADRLTVKIDADLSELERKIDAMQARLESVKNEIERVCAQISALSSNAARLKRYASSNAFAATTGPGGEAGKVLSEIEKKLLRQAAMISK